MVFDRLEYPSFIEFDDVNSKVLSYNAATKCVCAADLAHALWRLCAEGHAAVLMASL